MIGSSMGFDEGLTAKFDIEKPLKSLAAGKATRLLGLFIEFFLLLLFLSSF